MSDDIFTTNQEYKSILQLDQLLTKERIPHQLSKILDGWRITYPSDKLIYGDVVEHLGSYGHDDDLMEAWRFELGDVRGHLTVEEAAKLFRAANEKPARICFRLNTHNPDFDPVYGCLTMTGGYFLIPYEDLTGGIVKEKILRIMGHEDLSPEDLEWITPEEYDRRTESEERS